MNMKTNKFIWTNVHILYMTVEDIIKLEDMIKEHTKKTAKLWIRITPSLKERIFEAAKKREIAASELARILIEDGLKKLEKY